MAKRSVPRTAPPTLDAALPAPVQTTGLAPGLAAVPPTPEILAAQARLHAPACLEALADEARTGSGSSRVSAAKAVLECGLGKTAKGTEENGHSALPVLPETLQRLLGDLYGPEDADA